MAIHSHTCHIHNWSKIRYLVSHKRTCVDGPRGHSTTSLLRFSIIIEFIESDTCLPRTVGPEISSLHVEGAGGLVIQMKLCDHTWSGASWPLETKRKIDDALKSEVKRNPKTPFENTRGLHEDAEIVSYYALGETRMTKRYGRWSRCSARVHENEWDHCGHRIKTREHHEPGTGTGKKRLEEMMSLIQRPKLVLPGKNTGSRSLHAEVDEKDGHPSTAAML
ncbi:hypothetical protein ARMSODRAFT_975204 [Armillaria solidipes]|uniref:Uncharacterized protein n=1 Tax=Armillaria solidipes TaxID=1076256 RepID=A0A2H3BF82_9AGAR|nr:hypothetical protein ARMSODRAFT_975204 [Armillaria solidipes]